MMEVRGVKTDGAAQRAGKLSYAPTESTKDRMSNNSRINIIKYDLTNKEHQYYSSEIFITMTRGKY